jgi:hypothetical protein
VIGWFIMCGSPVAFVHFRRQFVDSYIARYEPASVANRNRLFRPFRGAPDFTPVDDPIVENRRKQQLLALAALPISFAVLVATVALNPHVMREGFLLVGVFWLVVAWIDEVLHLFRQGPSRG